MTRNSDYEGSDLGQIPTGALEDELDLRERRLALGEAVTGFCERVGLPTPVSEHVTKQLLSIDPGDMGRAAACLDGITELFAQDAKLDGEHAVLPWPSGAQSPRPSDLAKVVEVDPRPAAASDSAISIEVSPVDEGESPLEPEWDSKGLDWAAKVLGRRIDPTVEAVEQVAALIYAVAGEPKTRARRGQPKANPIKRLQARLQGMSDPEISAFDGSSIGSISQWFIAIARKASDHEAPSVETVLAFTEPESAEPEKAEQPLEDEPRHVQITERYMQSLLPDVNKSAFKGLIDPKNTGDLVDNKIRIIDRIRELIKAKTPDFSLLNELDISESAKWRLRELLGIYHDQNEKPSFRKPIDLRRQLQSAREPRERRTREDGMYEGLESLYEALTERAEDSRPAQPELVITDTGVPQVKL